MDTPTIRQRMALTFVTGFLAFVFLLLRWRNAVALTETCFGGNP
jgi:hypothetical protein